MAKETAEQKLLKMMQKTSGAAPAPAVKAANKNNFVFSMRTLNQILMLGIVVCAVGLVYELQSGSNMLKHDIDLSEDTKNSTAIASIALPSSKDVKFYLNKISTRNIFRPYDAQAAKGAAVQQNLAKRLSKFKLVGVAWLDLPETASIMIEDTANKTTYFLKQGEQLEGVTVKTIYTDRVVFGYENEETTIKL